MSETVPDGYNAEVVLQAVIMNLLRDANMLVDEELASLAKLRRASGWPFDQHDYDALRKPLLENIVRLFADRLVNGLLDEPNQPAVSEGDGDE